MEQIVKSERLVFKSISELEVFVSGAGFLCLKQEAIEFGKEATITLSPDQARAVARFIEQQTQNMDALWNNGVYLDVGF